MQEICSSNPPVVPGICDPDNSRAQHHHKLSFSNNVKEIQISNKRIKLFEYLRNCIIWNGFIFLQEILLTNNDKKYWQDEFNFSFCAW